MKHSKVYISPPAQELAYLNVKNKLNDKLFQDQEWFLILRTKRVYLVACMIEPESMTSTPMIPENDN